MEKEVSASYTEQVQILNQSNINGYKRLFGGQLMQWIDIVAAVTARRHCEHNVTTVLVDRLEFKKPAHANDMILLTGHVEYVGKTSMDVCVNTYIEELNGGKTLINTAHLVMVALDENDCPTEVPRLILRTDKERADWDAAKKRRELCKMM